jgi:hypothetical protein
MKNTSKNSYFFLLVLFVVTALLVGTPTYAQDKTSEIDKIFSSCKCLTHRFLQSLDFIHCHFLRDCERCSKC